MGTGWRVAIAVVSATAWLAFAGAGAALADGSGTFECQYYDGNGNLHVVVDTSMSAGTSGSTGIGGNQTPSPSVRTYCTLTGTIPTDWTVSLYGGTPLYADDGSANDGTLELGPEYDSFTGSSYTSNLLGYGTFTNDGSLLFNEYNPDSNTNGYSSGVEMPNFVNDGTVDATEPAGGSGSVAWGFGSVGAAANGLPPTVAMTITNDGTFEVDGSSSMGFSSTSGTGNALTIDNAGQFDVAGTASVTVGQSNQYYCHGQSDPITWVQAPGSDLANSGAFTDFCNTFQMQGQITGGSAPLMSGVELEYAKGLTRQGGDADTVAINAGSFSGTNPSGWTLETANEVTAEPGAANSGTMYAGYQISDTATFSNHGTLYVGTHDGTAFQVPTLVNTGRVIMQDGAYVNQLFVDGAFTQTAAGKLQVVLTSGDSSQIDVRPGPVSLAGTLELKTDSSAPPTPGESMQIIAPYSANLSGTFSSVTGTTYGHLAYSVGYSPNGAYVSATATEPINTSPPSISGTTDDGDKLQANTGSWSGPSTLTYSYLWKRCYETGPKAGKCIAIAGATGQDYTLTSADVGQQVEVQVTATDQADTAVSATSGRDPASGSVGPPAPPSNTAAPVISCGTQSPCTSPAVGTKVTASTGSWQSPDTLKYTYQWYDCTAASGGTCTTTSTGPSRTLSSADNGSYVEVVVTATDQEGQTGAGSSTLSSATT